MVVGLFDEEVAVEEMSAFETERSAQELLSPGSAT